MKLIATKEGQSIFQLGQREWGLLLALLRRYPAIPPAHQRLSQSMQTTENNADQRLLDEALAEQRQQHKRRVQALLNDPRRMTETKEGFRLALSSTDMEVLLQVLNDIRVGSWIAVGSPENDLWNFELNESTAPHAWAMEAAGYFQMNLLDALAGHGAD